MSKIEQTIIEEAKRFIRSNRGLKIDKSSSRASSYQSPRISSEFLDCSLPMTFDHYSFCSLGCQYCFAAGTKILMAKGIRKAIHKIEKGDLVISYNEKLERFETAEVTATMNRKAEEIITLIVDTKTGPKKDEDSKDRIRTRMTPEHPVFVKGFGWKEAKKLKIDDEVMVW